MKNLTVIIGRTLVASTLVMVTPAWAQQPPLSPAAPPAALTPAQKLYDEGKKAAEENRWPDALRMFADAYKLDPQPKTAARLGHAQVELGDYIAGATNLETYLREEKELPEKARQNVLLKQTEAKAKIVTVQLKGTPSDATVLVDKVPLDTKRVEWPIFLVPGGHSFEVQKTGCETFRQDLTGKPGDEFVVDVKLVCTGSKNGDAHEVKKGGVPPLAIAGFAVSGSLLLTSAITGIVAKVANEKAIDAAFDRGCTSDADCDAVYAEQYGRSGTFTTVSLISVGVGVGVGVASLIYTLKAPKPSDTTNAPKTSFIVLPTVGGIVVQGAW